MNKFWPLWLFCFFISLPGRGGADTVMPLRDPTQPLTFEAQSVRVHGREPLQLSAVFAREYGASAIINGQRVAVGDRVGGVTIVRITTGRVYFQGEQSGVLLLHTPILTASEDQP